MNLGTALIYDLGALFPYIAQTLAEGFERVLYCTPRRDPGFPQSRHDVLGEGLPGVERTNEFFEHVGEADTIVFPDVGMGDLQVFLRGLGKNVWGSGHAEILELDRVGLKKLLRVKRLPLPPTWIIQGVDALREHLEDPENDEQFVKISTYRGDFESYAHKNSWLSETWLRFLDHQLGPLRDRIEFVVEGKIEGVEVGYDGYCIDGRFPKTALYGYEAKDVAYIGRVVSDQALPNVLRATNAALATTLAELGCRSLFSSEVRVDEDGVGYPIDLTLRAPSPPSEGMMAVFKNWPEIIAAGAAGELVEPIPVAKFCATLVLRSPWAAHDFLPIKIPDEVRHLTKLHNHAILDGTDYVVSVGMDIIGQAVGLGDTMEEACQQAKEVAEALEAHELDYEERAFEGLSEKIEQGIQHGVNWS